MKRVKSWPWAGILIGIVAAVAVIWVSGIGQGDPGFQSGAQAAQWLSYSM